MNAPDKIYIDDLAVVNDCITKNSTNPLPNFSEYIRKDTLLEWVRLAYGKLSMNTFDVRDVFEELINKIK